MKISDRLTSFMHDRLVNEHKDSDYKAAFESEQIRRQLDRTNSMLRQHPLDPPEESYEEAKSTLGNRTVRTGMPTGHYRTPPPAAPKENDKDLYLSGKPDYSQIDRPTAHYQTPPAAGSRIDLPTAHYQTPTPAEPKNPKYSSLHTVLKAAYDQASKGKGSERHGNGKAFEDQPMQSISNLLDSTHGMAFQAIKKIKEAEGMETFEQKERELLGAINYIAGIIIFEKSKAGVAK
tara:strand:+ start:13339 stop:14040 length:702 start_codon:yes stop_codon:yes gene_type:complete